MHDFKFTKVQVAQPGDIMQSAFCENILNHIRLDQGFLKRIIWTDEAKFSEEGVFNATMPILPNNENIQF